MTGLVSHHGTEEKPGLGLEIVKIEEGYIKIWNLFIKALFLLEEAQTLYEEIKSKET